VLESLIQRGRLQGAMNKWQDAIATLATAREQAVAHIGTETLDVAEIDKDLGYAYGHVDKLAEAEARYRHALAIEEKAFGATSPTLAGPLRGLGTILVMANKLADAVAPLQRAYDVLKTGSGDPLDLADVELQLAYAFENTQRPRALDFAKAALAEYDKQQVAEARDEAKALIARLGR
jgi:tetratricopeptide (TPR) repeat protein